MSTDDMVERVRLAIVADVRTWVAESVCDHERGLAEARTDQERNCHQGALAALNVLLDSLEWGGDIDSLRIAARSAIEAMREPTEAMCKAAGFNSEEDGPENGYLGTETNWMAMVDVALGKKEP